MTDIPEATLKQGFKDALPIFLGYYTTSIAFGLIAVTSGLTVFESVLFSMTNLTGAAQFLAINLLSSGAALGEIVTSVFLLNLRYVIMSASLARKLKLNKLSSLIIAPAGVTDEIFSVASFKKGKVKEKYLYGLQSLSWSGWVAGTLTGATVGNLLPPSLQEAVAIALFALFVALLTPEIKKSGIALALSLSAAALNSLLYYGFHMSPGWSIVISMVITTLTGAAVMIRMNRKPVAKGGHDE